MGWRRGLNFSQTKYKLVSKREFTPYMRSNFRTAIPCKILENFEINNDGVALLKIKDIGKQESLRIKKLLLEANSYTISLKAEKFFQKPQVEVIDIKSEKDALSRNANNLLSLKNFIPKYTNSVNGSTPIYVFDYNSKLVVGGYYKKDLLIKNKLKFDESSLSALGLYFAEGGKTAASFTNSWPQAINQVLFLIEDLFNLKKEKIKASICCNHSLKNKQKQLEKFWKEETGISNFSRTLHFNKNSTSPQGILELYFCSEVIRNIFVNILQNILNYKFNESAFLTGLFSGDASPIRQTKYNITHHITFSEKEKPFYFKLFTRFFPKTNIKAIGNKFTVYSSWEKNRELLLKDIYKFNPPNRIKFAKNFFSLPKTQKIISKDKKLKEFKKKKYPLLLSELFGIYQKLVDFKVYNQDFMGGKKEEWIE